MSRATVTGLAVAGLGVAQLLAGVSRYGQQGDAATALPPARSPVATSMLSLGYRELCADYLWVRGLTYGSTPKNKVAGLVNLANAALACDPYFESVYDWAPRAIEFSAEYYNTPQSSFLAGIEILERGIAALPNAWNLQLQAGQIYSVDLRSDDAAQQAAWRERGATLLERVARMPGAPPYAGALAASIRTNLGQFERAKRNLREMIALESSQETKDKLIEKLARLEKTSAEALRDETDREAAAFTRSWKATRPELPASDYIVFAAPAASTTE